MKIVSVNPFTAETMREFDTLDFDQCREAVEQGREAFGQWKEMSFPDRERLIGRLGEALRDGKQAYAELITREMGKPIRQSLGEIEKCAWLCDYVQANACKLLRDDFIETEATRSYVTFQPLGVILGIMPWNFPFWQVFRFAVPAMAAGNVCLLKHASNVPLTALEIEKVFREAGFPPHAFQTLIIDSKTAGKLIEEDLVDGVSLTGSVAAGAKVGSLAGRQIRKLVLELGGSDPFIVLDDADLERAAENGVQSRTLNGGQSCIAAKRFIVMESVYEAFRDTFIEKFQAQKVGDPMDSATDIGPMAREEFIESLESQLEDAKQKGADIAYGSEPPKGKGFFFRPAVVSRVRPDMAVLREEVFGPIAPILSARDEDEIIRIANATEFGLGASIWSRNLERAEALSRHIDSGFIAINDIVRSDPRLPFGGTKKSGVGRELSSYGLKEFVNVKTIVVK